MKRLLLGLCLVAPLQGALAASVEAEEAFFFQSLSKYCVGQIWGLKALTLAPEKNGLTQVVGSKAQDLYLQGQSGTVWSATNPETKASSVVVISDDFRVCHVFAKTGLSRNLERSFDEALSDAPVGAKVRELEFESKASPKLKDYKMRAFGWSVPGFKDEMIFVLTTPKNEPSAFKAMATVTIKPFETVQQ